MNKPKSKVKHDWLVSHARAWTFSILGVLVTGLAFGGWKASQFIENDLASKAEVIVAQAQATTALDTQMEDLIAKIARLEAKSRKTQDDRDQIKYLREQLERIRRIRAIK